MTSVLITGTSKGIGLATTLILARAGYTVHATMRDPARSQLGQIAEKERLPIRISRMDVNNDASVRETIAAILAQDSIDVLVNNAGIERTGSVEELPLSEIRAIMETNYFGAIRCIQAILPEMRKRRSGCIINVTSVAGRISSSPLGCYAASKFALEALSEALAQETKLLNIRVAMVEPGIIDTDMPRAFSTRPSSSPYPQSRRMSAMFAAALQQTAPPDLVGQKIREIIESGSWQLRHPVGPDAEDFLKWRASLTDEEFVDWGGADDETWYSNVQRTFGMDLRAKRAEQL